MFQLQYLQNVSTLKLNSESCKGCGVCVTVCPHAVFKISGGKAQITDINNCMECGACSRNCQYGAISVRSGVGCAAGIINGFLNNSEPTCGCSETSKNSCC